MANDTPRQPKTKTIRVDHYQKERDGTHILYRCFSRRKLLLYVGMTNNPEYRFKQHSRDKIWWKYVDRITLQPFKSRQLLTEAEAAAIQIEKPKFNLLIPNGAVPEHPSTGRMPRSVFPHASNFATVLPDHLFYLDQTLEQQLYPCVECHARAIYCEGEVVACNLCHSEWTFDQWFTMTFGSQDTPVGQQIPLM